MINSKEKQLNPNSDTLDKAIQASWESNNLSKSILILATLTQNHEILNQSELNHHLVKSLDKSQFKFPPIQPSNRTICTLLQIASQSGKSVDIDRVLGIIQNFDRELPQWSFDSKINQEQEETIKDSKKFQDYWIQQTIWLTTDLLDRSISRMMANPDKLQNEEQDEQEGKRIQLSRLESWRNRIDQFLASSENQDRFRELRLKIESRSNERRMRRESVNQNLIKPKKAKTDQKTDPFYQVKLSWT